MAAEATNGGTLLTYTVTNDRGWNDPPVHIFSPGGGNRKRNNLNKRVGHSLNSNGTSLYINQTAFPLNNAQNGLNPNNPHPTIKTPDFFPQTNGVNDLTQNLQQMSFNHSNSNPDLHQVCSSPPEMHHTSSYPYNINKVGLTSAHNPNQLSNHSSINDQLKTSPQENIFKNNFRRFSDISVPGKVSDPSSIFSQLGTPTMLKSSHLQTETENSSQHSDPKYSGFVNCDKPSRISPIGGYQTPPIAEYLIEHSTMSPVPLSQPPQQCNGFVASSSASNVQRSNCVGPPPTAGYYIQNEKGSPNRSSPVSLRARSPMIIANVSIENDNELLESTIKNLQECREKCLCHLNSRNSDEISKKIISFQQTWSSGKLSAAVKLQMSELASALHSMDFGKADQIHKCLILDYSNEVTSWIVGIKKLVVTSQQALIENNKFIEDNKFS